MKKMNLVTLLLVTLMLAGSFYIQPISQTSELGTTEAPVFQNNAAGFDSDDITIGLINVTTSEGTLAGEGGNQTTLVGTVFLFFDITSVNGPVNISLYVDSEIYYSDYNHTEISPGTLNMTVDSTILPEGLLNFTVLLEENSTGVNEKESYHLVFTVDNHGAPIVELLSPAADATFTGLDDLELNITSDYPEVFLNISIDGRITSEFNATVVPIGAANFTINGTRYENGHHEIDIVVYTEEGLQDSTSVTLIFLDYVRFYINDISEYARILGVYDFDITILTPYENVTISAFVDGELDSSNEYILTNDTVTFSIDTTKYSEGEHNFTFIAEDEYGHTWKRLWIFDIDNHGVPEIEFVSPTQDVIIGYAAIVVNIESTWDTVIVKVYVDDAEIANYTDVVPGDFTFYIDTSLYTKWEHTLKVVVETEEGETAEVEDTLGFASIRIEEVISLVVLLSLAIAIPFVRKKSGEPLRPILILDLVYLAIVAAGFLLMGVTNLTYAVWHFNLGSIWILGSILVILNYVFPLLKEE